MQIASLTPSSVRAMPIALDPAFPIHAPYLERLHYSKPHPADHMHYHASCEIGICLKGSGIFYIGSRVHRYAEGDVSVIAPGVIHIAQSDPERISGWKFLDVDLPRMLAGLPDEYAQAGTSGFCGIIHPPQAPRLAPLVLGIIDELADGLPMGTQMVRLKTAEIAILLSRLSGGAEGASGQPEALKEVSPAVLYIVNHYQESVTLDQLSAMCSKSVSSFRRAFEEAMSVSPFEYLYRVRIKAATSLLKTTSLPVLEVASRVGYQTLSSFNRHFRRIAGATPMECRKGGGGNM
jgi:AraC-like DNA-binding protein/mannose-6-phosphate isomerase-like protein (cupin superfamily)